MFAPNISQSITVEPPTIIPVTAPLKLVLRQNKENSITAENAPPNPAQPLETRSITLLLGSRAMTKASKAIAKTDKRLIQSKDFSEIFYPLNSLYNGLPYLRYHQYQRNSSYNDLLHYAHDI